MPHDPHTERSTENTASAMPVFRSPGTDDAPRRPGGPDGAGGSGGAGYARGVPDAPGDAGDAGAVPDGRGGAGGSDDGPHRRPPRRPAPRSRRARRLWAALAALLLVASTAGAAMVPLPYYLFRPGAVRDTEPLIEVAGGETYPSEGSISYTTVSLRQATLFGLVSGWVDDDVAVIDRDEVLGDHGAEENRQINLELMDNSKQVATQVALERLGYEVEVSVTGHVVFEVLPGMPAEGVLSVGDTIVAVDDVPIDDPEDLHRLLGEESPGSSVMITVESPEPGVPPAASPTLGPRGGDDEGGDRDGAGGQNGDQRDADDPELEQRDVEITLAASPDDPNRAVMGVEVGPRLDYHFPIDVAIDTGDVGGPSAGLAFTLGLIDDLTPGDLTGGLGVAVTGEILADGTVGPVGGAGQKAAAVRDAGLDLFLVPSADYDAAVEHAGDVEVVRVDTLDEALEELAERGGNALDLPQVGEASGRAAA